MTTTLKTLTRPHYPDTAIDIGDSHILLAQVGENREKKERYLKKFFIVETPEDILNLSKTSPNIRSLDGFGELIKKIAKATNCPPGKVSLSLPDSIAQVSTMQFDNLPGKRDKVLEMLQWRLKKSVPYKVEEGKIDYTQYPITDNKGKRNILLVSVIRDRILSQYEEIFDTLGFQPGWITLSSFALFNLYRTLILDTVGDNSDFLLCNSQDGFFSFMIFRGTCPIFYRCKGIPINSSSREIELYGMVERELPPTLEFYRTRLQGKGLEKIYLRATGRDIDVLLDTFKAGTRTEVEWIDPTRVLTINNALAGKQPLLQRASSVLGLAMRKFS